MSNNNDKWGIFHAELPKFSDDKRVVMPTNYTSALFLMETSVLDGAESYKQFDGKAPAMNIPLRRRFGGAYSENPHPLISKERENYSQDMRLAELYLLGQGSHEQMIKRWEAGRSFSDMVNCVRIPFKMSADSDAPNCRDAIFACEEYMGFEPPKVHENISIPRPGNNSEGYKLILPALMVAN